MKALVYILICLILLSCDENSFKKEIDLKSEDNIQLLCVSAILDNNTLFVNISAAIPVSGVAVELKPINKAKVSLYESDTLIFEKVVYNNNQPFLRLSEQIAETTPGKKYKLVVTTTDLPEVYSEVTAPDYPLITDVIVDDKDVITRPYSSVFTYNIFNCSNFVPFNFTIEDKWPQRNYYLIEALNGSEVKIGVATLDRILIQDNPIAEVNDLMTSTDYNTFMFSDMLISDLTFSEKKIELNMLLSKCNYDVKIIKFKSINRELFDYYRGYALQEDGFTFYGEPVSIKTNIVNGYGYFGITSTVSVNIE